EAVQSRNLNDLQYSRLHLVEHMQVLLIILDSIQDHGDHFTKISELHVALEDLWLMVNNIMNPPVCNPVSLSLVQTRGRPRYHITVGQLSQLRATGMSWISIADILGISLSTVSRRRDMFELVENYYAIPNSQLNEIIRDITAHTANAGERLVQ
ncbi:ATP-dependent DNA helicase PIF1, partial [Clarias magur]